MDAQDKNAANRECAFPHTSSVQPIEEADYLKQGDDQVYYVLHSPTGPRLGQVLLAGPFASERPHTYISWVRWARFLANHGFEVLRFDYRGVGESTGRFEDLAFTSWLEDLRLCAQWLGRQGESCPLTLHGLRLGALLAARAFEDGLGDALLLWSPPASAQEMLHDTLRRRLATDFVLEGNARRKSREDYIAELEAGRLVEVEGYLWSKGLWKQSPDFTLTPPKAGNFTPADRTQDRPWEVVHLDRTAGCLSNPYGTTFTPRARTRPQPLNPDLTDLFTTNLRWIRQAVAGTVG